MEKYIVAMVNSIVNIMYVGSFAEMYEKNSAAWGKLLDADGLSVGNGVR